MEPPRNRLLDLLNCATRNGIDYVEVREAEPERLYVHFINTVPVAEAGLKASIVGGDRLPSVAVAPLTAGDWSSDAEGRPILALRVAGRGDFSTYTLNLDGGNRLDDYFRQVRFSFYAFCPSQVDCQQPPDDCPAPTGSYPPIDYLAKDYDSFRLALSEFSAQRFPEWRERAEADLGMVLLEALSAIGDDLSYLQDRVHREATLETATELRSLVRLARLVEYEPRPQTSAGALLRCEVAAGTTELPAGILVTALAPDGSVVPFETGTGLRDTTKYPVADAWNAMKPYWWDDGERCLNPGATSLDLRRQGLDLLPGLPLLIETAAASPAEPPLCVKITLVMVAELTDPLYGEPLTRITWRPQEALTQFHDLTRTLVRGNLVPATQGRRQIERFAIHRAPPDQPDLTLAIERQGPNSTAAVPRWQALYPLRGHPLAYLGQARSADPEPELVLRQTNDPPLEWHWVKRLLEADAFEQKFTLEPAAWRPVLRTAAGTSYEYDGAEGTTIRFGNGDFGALPDDGDCFEVHYRVGRGAVGNVAADTITGVDPSWGSAVLRVTNPFPATGGAAAESVEQVRRRAPFAFRNMTYRAVRPEDYSAAATRLDWVQGLGARFRWTGSWPTLFATADPKNSADLDRDRQVELLQLLNRHRLAGYECYVPAARYVSFDLSITVCALPTAYRGDVQAGLRRALDPVRYPDGSLGFFHVDNFTLGTAFERSRLEAAIQGVSGVAGVHSILYRRRGYLNTFADLPPRSLLAPGEIFRLDNNLSRPERGSYRLQVEGGK
ncbi:hypothetical protein [uncultured Thiodictyon sp.]|uniref:hypothetical protein n=1 Tax=uncultured Thiodictyon sp. TaxID=1846217 RepID=UPI0025E1EC01|nr:hypothetical protein [uncultured Thiodictyon sp.]